MPRNRPSGRISCRKPGSRKPMIISNTPGSSNPWAACARYLMKRPLMMITSSTALTALRVNSTSRDK
ncbi:hypothetical protein D3C71_2074100 [compost metagenome]